jgi:hypothetical protein
MPTSTPQSIRRKPGRPPVEDSGEPVTVRITNAALARLDAWRRVQADLPSRPKAIRRLLELGFATAADAGPRDPTHNRTA